MQAQSKKGADMEPQKLKKQSADQKVVKHLTSNFLLKKQSMRNEAEVKTCAIVLNNFVV